MNTPVRGAAAAFTADDALLAAEILRQLSAGHEEGAWAVAPGPLNDMSAAGLEYLCALHDVEV
jgi:hypothetical protein